MKTCKKCGGSGPFHKKSVNRDGLSNICAQCANRRHAGYRQSERYIQTRDEWKTRNREKIRTDSLAKYYRSRDTNDGRASFLIAAAKKRVGKTNVSLDRNTIAQIIASGYCQVTGLPFDLATHSPFAPSLDRKDPTIKQYTPENTQVVVAIYNIAKADWSHGVVLRLAHALTNRIMKVPVSIGELYDRITILEIKVAKVTDLNKLDNIKYELRALEAIAKQFDTNIINHLIEELRAVNRTIWDIEDGIRSCERSKTFNDKFVELARGVYYNNDKRATIKKEINTLMNSEIVEEKSYTAY